MTAFPKPPKRGRKPPKPLRRSGRPRPTRQTSRAALIRLADDLCSTLVRARAGNRCEACFKAATDCAHGEPRRKLSVRWDHRNTFALCRECHDRFGSTEAWREWRVTRIGEAMILAVEEIARKARSVTEADLRGIVDGLRRGVFVQGARVLPWAA